MFTLKLNVAKALKQFRKLPHDVQLVLIIAMLCITAMVSIVVLALN